jgi:hypothetical protein
MRRACFVPLFLVALVLVGCAAEQTTSSGPETHGGLTRAEALRAAGRVAAKFDLLGDSLSQTLNVDEQSHLQLDTFIGSDTFKGHAGWIAKYVDPEHSDGEALCIQLWGDTSKPEGYDYIWQSC